MTTNSTLTLPGYWCECAVDTPVEQYGWKSVAAFEAYSADQAIGWVLGSLSRLEAGLTPQDSRAVSHWLLQGHWKSVKDLQGSQELSFFIAQGTTRIEWTIRRVTFLRLLDRHDEPPDYIELAPIEARIISL